MNLDTSVANMMCSDATLKFGIFPHIVQLREKPNWTIFWRENVLDNKNSNAPNQQRN